MNRISFLALSFVLLATASSRLASSAEPDPTLKVGFAEADITPEVGPGKPAVWMAGYGMGRAATGVHDPLMARAMVLATGKEKLAIASVDLVGLQFDAVERIRAELADFAHVTVGSTHNHEAPDVIGIWGPSPIQRGVDDRYLDLIVKQVVAAVREAEDNLAPAKTSFGTATDETLLNDSRKPQIKDGVLRAVKFESLDGKKTTGLLVQWNCHPEALGSKNKLLTADFCGTTVAELKAKHNCPVLLMTGVVGGLLAPPRGGRIKDASGAELKEGDYAYAEQYGREVALLANKALAETEAFNATPLKFATRRFALPVENKLYRSASALKVLPREAREWTGDPLKIGAVQAPKPDVPMAVVTETACLKLGELVIVNIPGEIYSELVLGKYQDPVEPGADFPDAPLEPSVVEMVGNRKWMLFGLANDELGYIIPKRQWDEKAPYCYGRTESQYGEINSCGPDAAPIIMKMLGQCVAEATSESARLSGKTSDWNGYTRYDFVFNDRPVTVVAPKEAGPGSPWVWHGEFFGHRPAPDVALLGKGFHIVYTQISDQFGSPTAIAHWNKLYDLLTTKHGLSKKVALVGLSRGGLYCYNWAAENPERVACIYADAPVCDVYSWPMGKGDGEGNSGEIPKLFKAYGVESEGELRKVVLNPIDRLEPLAKAKVPLLHVYGDADVPVPWKANTGVVAERYKKLGGAILLIPKPGVGHVHGLDDSTPVVDFIYENSMAQFGPSKDKR